MGSGHLSVGSVIAFTGVFLAKVIGDLRPIAAAGVSASACDGPGLRDLTLTGFWIHARILVFIITLAGMFFLRGVSYLISATYSTNHPVDDTLSSLAWKIPARCWLKRDGGQAAVVVIGIFLAHRTRFVIRYTPLAKA